MNFGTSFSGYCRGPYTLFPLVMMHGSLYEHEYACNKIPCENPVSPTGAAGGSGLYSP